MSPGSYPWDLVLLLGHIFFPNMVVWLIKLKEMVSRMGYKLNVDPMVKLETLRYFCIVNRSLSLNFSENYANTSNLKFLDVSKFRDCCLIAQLHVASLLHQ